MTPKGIRSMGRIVVFMIALVAPNLIWLGSSTVRITNASDKSITAVAYTACGTRHAMGALAPKASVFHFLEAYGDDTLEIVIADRKYFQT
jgi:hypothetical protein